MDSQRVIFISVLLIVFPTSIDAQLKCDVVLRGTYDYIVVGGGTSGAVLASRLSEDNDVRVLLLEAGSEDSDIFESHVIDTPGLSLSLVGSDVDWKYETEPQKHCCEGLNEKRTRISRGKVLGGTSALDQMEHLRGSRYVYDEWEEMGAEGWNYTSIKDYFIKSENVNIERVPRTVNRGGCGPIPIAEQKDDSLRYAMFRAGTEEIGWPVIECNEEENIGLCRSQLSMKNGQRVSTAKAYLRPVWKRTNLDILTEATVNKIIFDEFDLIVKAVRFDYHGKPYTIKVRHEVILAAGPIGTPKLLMLSGIGDPLHLEAMNVTVYEDLPVGDNLQDGYIVPLRLYVNLPTYRPDKPLENVQRWRDYIYLRQGELADGLLDAHYHLRTLPSKTTQYPDIQISVKNMLPDNDHSLLRKMNVKPSLINSWYKKGRGRNGVFLHLGLMHPKSKGSLRLRSNDPSQNPIIDPNYLEDPDDVEELLKGVRFIQALQSTVAFKAVNAELDEKYPGCREHTFNTDDYWRCYIRQLGYSANEIVGTARMGRKADNSTVVDEALRVKGIQGLRVADASIMPQTTGSTRATVIMIGEKAADLIKADLSKSKENIKKRTANMDKTKLPFHPLIGSLLDAEQTIPISKNEKVDPTKSPELKATPNGDLLNILEQLLIDPSQSGISQTGTETGSKVAGSLGGNLGDFSNTGSQTIESGRSSPSQQSPADVKGSERGLLNGELDLGLLSQSADLSILDKSGRLTEQALSLATAARKVVKKSTQQKPEEHTDLSNIPLNFNNPEVSALHLAPSSQVHNNSETSKRTLQGSLGPLLNIEIKSVPSLKTAIDSIVLQQSGINRGDIAVTDIAKSRTDNEASVKTFGPPESSSKVHTATQNHVIAESTLPPTNPPLPLDLDLPGNTLLNTGSQTIEPPTQTESPPRIIDVRSLISNPRSHSDPLNDVPMEAFTLDGVIKAQDELNRERQLSRITGTGRRGFGDIINQSIERQNTVFDNSLFGFENNAGSLRSRNSRILLRG